jgi:predicted Holliday junction resolvase-like endonuclease
MSTVYSEFQEFRKILCVCPCCGDIVRVSDLKLRTKGPSVKTWLDEYQTKLRLLEKQEERFEEKADEIRAKSQELGRKESQKITRKAMPQIFKTLKIDPQDVKPILNPVEYVVFKGMNQKKEIDRILLLAKKTKNPQLSAGHKQIQQVIKKENYSWQVARIDEKGKIAIEM